MPAPSPPSLSLSHSRHLGVQGQPRLRWCTRDPHTWICGAAAPYAGDGSPCCRRRATRAAGGAQGSGARRGRQPGLGKRPAGGSAGPPGAPDMAENAAERCRGEGQLTANQGGRCPPGALGLLRGRPSPVEKDTGRLEGGVAPGSRVALLGEAMAALSPTPPAWAPRLCTWPTCARGRASHALAAPNTRGRAKKGEVQGPTQGHMGTWDCWADGTARLSPRPHKHRLHEDNELTTHRTPAPL